MRTKFGIGELTLVGDRGMITSARIEALRELGGLSWISLLRAPATKAVAADDGPLQMGQLIAQTRRVAPSVHKCSGCCVATELFDAWLEQDFRYTGTGCARLVIPRIMPEGNREALQWRVRAACPLS